MLVLLSVAMREWGLARPSRRHGDRFWEEWEQRLQSGSDQKAIKFMMSSTMRVAREGSWKGSSGRETWESKERIGKGGSMKLGSVINDYEKRGHDSLKQTSLLIKSEFDTNGKRERFRIWRRSLLGGGRINHRPSKISMAEVVLSCSRGFPSQPSILFASSLLLFQESLRLNQSSIFKSQTIWQQAYNYFSSCALIPI